MTRPSAGNLTLANSSILFARAFRDSERVLLPINESATRGEARQRFYCVHSISGAAGTDFISLARRLDCTASFYGLQAPPKLMHGGEFGSSIEGLADHYVKALVRFQPEGSLMIGGFCIGAIIALDMAKKLRAMGREVGPVIAIDGAPENVPAMTIGNTRYWLEMVRNVPRWLLHAELIRSPSVRSLMWSLSKHAIAVGKLSLGLRRMEKLGGGYAIDSIMDLSVFPAAQRLFINRLFSAAFLYVPDEYAGEVIVYEAKVAPLLYLPQIGRIWRKIAARSEIVSIVATHKSIMHDPYVAVLADDMRARITKFFAESTK